MASVKLPAIGFAVGDVTLLDLLRSLPHTAALLEADARSVAGAQVFGIITDESVRPQALASVQGLRASGLRVDFSLVAAKLDKQFQMAGTVGAVVAVIYGAEWPLVKIKHLARREETSMAHEHLLEAVRMALDKR